MPRKYVFADDFDGADLPDDTKPIPLSLGRTTYNLYLSEKNHGKLLKALEPFITNAETTSSTAAAPRSSGSTGGADTKYASLNTDDKKAVRAWAQSTGFKYTNAAGEEKTLGDRGRVPDEVVDAWQAAN